MASITTWQRLEPHCRNADLEHPLQMRIHDPLWLLGRQWQFGEFLGVNGGTPTQVTWSAAQIALDQLRLGSDLNVAAQEVDSKQPLEYLIERETESAASRFQRNKLLAAQAGLRFLSILHHSDNFGASYARDIARNCLLTFTPEQDTSEARDFISLMAGRAIDAAKLLAKTEVLSAANLVELGFVDSAEHDRARVVINAWRDWCAEFVGQIGGVVSGSGAWSSAKQEYSAKVSAGPASPSPVDLSVGYRGGHLDWYSFDEEVGPQLPVQASVTQVAQPTKLSFYGRIGSKIWEFEEPETNLDAISVPASDVVQFPFMEALLQYGNDFFRIAVEIDHGSICVSERLKVEDCFGNETEVSPYKTTDWRMFALSARSNPKDILEQIGFFVPAIAGQDIADLPIEHVSLLRDEMANLAWAIESKVESTIGKPLDRHEAYHAKRASEPPYNEGNLTYELDGFGRLVPDYWIPMLAAGVAGRTSLECPQQAAGRIRGLLLSECLAASEKGIHDEEIPRSGVRVQRSWQCARGSDGTVLVWIGREKRLGRGEGSSGLVYDTVRNISTP